MAVLSLVSMLALLTNAVRGGEFQISFLDEPSALEDTCRILKEAGFSEQTLLMFQTVVTNHNKLGNFVDRTKFPRVQNGFYRFQNVKDLTMRFSCPFGRAASGKPQEHGTLMCFDVTALLLKGAGYGTPFLEQRFKGIVLPMPAGWRAKSCNYGEFRTAFSQALCAESDFLGFVGRPRSAEETQLELSLIAPRELMEFEAQSEKIIRATHQACCQAMESFGFVYDQKVQLGLVSCVDFKGHSINPDHVFVCVRREDRLICLEKTSPKGPYVRADFGSEEDLGRYELSTYVDYPLAPGDSGHGSPVVVSLGKQILMLHQPVAPALSK